jgi:hypothetical protein
MARVPAISVLTSRGCRVPRSSPLHLSDWASPGGDPTVGVLGHAAAVNPTSMVLFSEVFLGSRVLLWVSRGALVPNRFYSRSRHEFLQRRSASCAGPIRGARASSGDIHGGPKLRGESVSIDDVAVLHPGPCGELSRPLSLLRHASAPIRERRTTGHPPLGPRGSAAREARHPRGGAHRRDLQA